MAFNEPSVYGLDFRCFYDADELLSDADGVEIVRQDVFHRLTQDDVVGFSLDSEDLIIVGHGYDVRKLLGTPAKDLPAQQIIISEVAQRDERVDTADVTLTAVTVNGVSDISLVVECTTANGPFSIVTTIQAIAASLGGSA